MDNVWTKRTEEEKKQSQCFVLMPLSQKWSDRIFKKQIKPNIEKCGMTCLRANDLYGPNIMEDVAKGIFESRIIIAEITGRNPNVFYELGASHSLGKDVIILTQEVSDIPFDIKGHRCIVYEDNADGYEVLEKELPKHIDHYLYSDLKDNYGEFISNEDKVVLFLSYGGTCRCAMANAITREYLKIKNCKSKIRPISAGLISESADFASDGAKSVVKEKLSSVSLDNHKTLKAEFPLLKRADLILPMDKRMLNAVPAQFRKKSKLFTEFFGSSGDVNDPFQYGYSVYLECFQFEWDLIGRSFENLCTYFVEK